MIRRTQRTIWSATITSPRAFSLTIRITQRDRGKGTDALGSRTRVPVRPPAGARPLDEPGLASPGSPAVSEHPACSPAVPEPVLEHRRHKGIPADTPAHSCAVTSDQLHRRSDAPRAVRTMDENASAPTI